MTDSHIIAEVQQLCRQGRYSAAIKRTNDIRNKNVAVKAHLLCIEHEQATLKKEGKK